MHQGDLGRAWDSRAGARRRGASCPQGSAKGRAISGFAEERPEMRHVPVLHRGRPADRGRHVPTGRRQDQPQRLVRALRQEIWLNRRWRCLESGAVEARTERASATAILSGRIAAPDAIETTQLGTSHRAELRSIVAATPAIASVAIHPMTARAGDTTNRPITCRLRAMSMITAMRGAAATPFSTALQNSALIGSSGVRLIRIPSPVATAIVP